MALNHSPRNIISMLPFLLSSSRNRGQEILSSQSRLFLFASQIVLTGLFAKLYPSAHLPCMSQPSYGSPAWLQHTPKPQWFRPGVAKPVSLPGGICFAISCDDGHPINHFGSGRSFCSNRVKQRPGEALLQRSNSQTDGDWRLFQFPSLQSPGSSHASHTVTRHRFASPTLTCRDFFEYSPMKKGPYFACLDSLVLRSRVHARTLQQDY